MKYNYNNGQYYIVVSTDEVRLNIPKAKIEEKKNENDNSMREMSQFV